jgi:hypothetical protein
MDKRNAAFARRLNAALESCGLRESSDGELAKLLARKNVSVSPQSVGNWRNGKHMPKLDQFVGLAAMLKADPGELAFGKSSATIGEQRAGYVEPPSDEGDVVNSYALLDDGRRARARELIRYLSLPSKSGKRPGRRRATAPGARSA